MEPAHGRGAEKRPTSALSRLFMEDAAGRNHWCPAGAAAVEAGPSPARRPSGFSGGRTARPHAAKKRRSRQRSAFGADSRRIHDLHPSHAQLRKCMLAKPLLAVADSASGTEPGRSCPTGQLSFRYAGAGAGVLPKTAVCSGVSSHGFAAPCLARASGRF